MPFEGLDRAKVGVLDRAVVLGLDLRLLKHLGGRAPDVERPHGQLGAGLADRLGGNDADRLAELGWLVGGQILPITGGADAAFGFAGQGGTDLHPLHAERLNRNGGLLGDDFTGGDHLPFADRIDDVVHGGPAINSVAEADDFIVPLEDRFHPDPPLRAAIRLTNDDIHGHVAELAGHVAGICGLQRGIGQSLAGAVGGDEILQHGQTFAEAGRDRTLDDFARGLGHQTAHARQLADLVAVASRPGIHHEVDGVKVLASLIVFKGPVHGSGDFLRRLGPDVDNLVVTLAVRDGAHPVLLLDLSHRLAGPVDHLRLFLGDDHVIDTDGDARTGGGREAEVLQLVQTLNRHVVTALFVATEDDLPELLLAGGLIEEANFRRPDAVEADPAGRGFEELLGRVPEDGFPSEVRILEVDKVVGLDAPLAHCEIHFVRVCEDAQALLLLHLLRRPDRVLGEVVATEGDVLAGRGDWAAVAGAEDIVWG